MTNEEILEQNQLIEEAETILQSYEKEKLHNKICGIIGEVFPPSAENSPICPQTRYLLAKKISEYIENIVPTVCLCKNSKSNKMFFVKKYDLKKQDAST